MRPCETTLLNIPTYPVYGGTVRLRRSLLSAASAEVWCWRQRVSAAEGHASKGFRRDTVMLSSATRKCASYSPCYVTADLVKPAKVIAATSKHAKPPVGCCCYQGIGGLTLLLVLQVSCNGWIGLAAASDSDIDGMMPATGWGPPGDKLILSHSNSTQFHLYG